MSAVLLLLATLAPAQNSQFLFDANGNLAVRMADTVFPPQITGQPQNQIVATNESAAFSVVVADPRSLTYQWRFNGANISGENGVSLLLDNVTTNNEGPYQVVLTNPSGSVTSAPAMLWIDNDGDGLGDSWEMTYFGNLNQYATTDFDHDGVSNLREFLDGTDPTDSNSAHFRLVIVREGGPVVKSPDQPSYNKGELVTLTVTASSNELFHAWLGDVVSRNNPVTLVMTNDKTVYVRFTPIVFNWTNVASGDWDTATNWTPNLAPGLNDIALITSGVTVTLNSNADCAEVTLGSPFATLTGSGTLTVRDNLLWTAGTMSGSGRTILETNSILNLPAGVSLNTRTLENGGTILWGGGGVFSVTGGAVITNRAGGLFRAENLTAAALGGGIAAGRIDNAGVFRKAAGTGPVTIQSGLNFNNSGTVEIQADTLLCNGGFTNTGAVILSPGTTNRLAAGGSAGGTFNAPATAMVEWTGGTFMLNPGAQLNGAGLYRISAATVTANANIAVENMDLINGTLDGTGTVTINKAMNWTAGTMGGSGRTIIPVGATLAVANPSAASLNGRTLENNGTVLWTGAGNIGLVSAVITNGSGALFHAQNVAALSFVSGDCRFDNAGTFRKSGNAGTTTVASGVGFNNSGTVEIQTGTLLCNGSFANNGAVNLSAGATNRLAGGGSANGSFTAPATTLVEWTSGTFTLNAGAQLNGAGLYRINGGTLTANTSLAADNLDLISGSLDGSGAVTVNNVMNWPSGTMGGSGRTIVATGATLTVANPSSVILSSRTLENGGTALWTGAGNIGLLGGIITNRAGALFHVQNAAIIASVGGGPRFDNAGIFRKSANTGTTTIFNGVNFNNYGTVDIRLGLLAANGGYFSSANALLNCALGGTTAGTGHGQLQVAGTVTLNGGLSVDLLPGFTPATNDTFTVVSAGSRSGTFANFFYPSNAVTMQSSNTANSVIVRVTDVFSVPQPAPVPAGLISWWRAEGNAFDSIGTNHGVLTNGATFAAGEVGQTFALDGANDYVQVPDSQTLRPASVTIEAWVKFFATNGIRIILVKPLGSGTFDSYGLALQDGAVLAAICDNSGFGPFLTGPANTVTGQWYHLAYTFDDASKQQVLYVNGIPVASGTANKTMSYDTHPVLLGADIENGVPSFFHNGQIDEASLYNRALTRDEILTIYNAGAAGKQSLTLPPPLLHIEKITAVTARLYWSTNYPDYHLEYNTSLGTTNWAASALTPVVTGTNFMVTNSLFGAQKYYRLSRVPATYTPPPPSLTIQRASPVTVRLLWPAEDDRTFTLESSTNLTTANWVTVSPAPAILGWNNVVTNPISGAQKFYRLFKP